MATLLLLEPDRLLAETYYQALITAGYDVSVCPSAQTAVLAADIITPDLVIVELQLVEHSGIEFLYEFRSYLEWQDTPVVIHTYVPPTEFNGNSKLMAQQLGVKAYLYKPHTTLQQLLKTVNQQLPVTV